MEEKIRKYLDQVFEEAPKSRRAFELKEELLANTIEHYRDLKNGGMNDEEACRSAIDALGNVSVLFKELETVTDLYGQAGRDMRSDRKKRAMLEAASVAMFIFAVAAFFGAVDRFGPGGISIMLLLSGIGVMLMVYARRAYPLGEEPEEGTVVGDFRQWRYSRAREREIMTAISSILWLAVIAIYFLVSFSTFRWDVTWILFLVGACAQAVVSLVFSLRKADRQER